MRFSCRLSGIFVFGTIIGMFVCATYPLSAVAVTTELPYTCTTTEEFAKTCTTGTYCCPNGLSKTTYGCPTGWALVSSTNTCIRGTAISSDSAGTYLETYGTCAPSKTSIPCCSEANYEIDGLGSCYACPK